MTTDALSELRANCSDDVLAANSQIFGGPPAATIAPQRAVVRKDRVSSHESYVVSEDAFQRAVIDLAHLHGWTVAHFRAARVRRGGRDIYETPVGADGKGFPDLVLAKKGRMTIFAELKSDKGRVTPEQQRWIDLLGGEVWRPGDWEYLEKVLEE